MDEKLVCFPEEEVIKPREIIMLSIVAKVDPAEIKRNFDFLAGAKK